MICEQRECNLAGDTLAFGSLAGQRTFLSPFLSKRKGPSGATHGSLLIHQCGHSKVTCFCLQDVISAYYLIPPASSSRAALSSQPYPTDMTFRTLRHSSSPQNVTLRYQRFAVIKVYLFNHQISLLTICAQALLRAFMFLLFHSHHPIDV